MTLYLQLKKVFIFPFFLIVDGRSPSIAAATTGGKVILHSPHDTQDTRYANDGPTNPVRYLNLNRKITALAAGKIGTFMLTRRRNITVF
jgi:hypothetical protein